MTTLVDVKGDAATGSLIVRIEAEAAEALRADPGTDQRLMAELARRSQNTVKRTDEGGAIEYRTTLPTGEILGLSGVRVDSVSRNGENSTVGLTMQSPALLAEAFRASVEGQTDGDARAIVMEKSTSICAQVKFAGAVLSASIDGGNPEVTRSEQDIRICSSMEALSIPLTIEVVGGNSRPLPVKWVVAASLLLALLAGFYRRSLKRKA